MGLTLDVPVDGNKVGCPVGETGRGDNVEFDAKVSIGLGDSGSVAETAVGDGDAGDTVGRCVGRS